ncbi:MAG: vWA domain-containing protein [Planctomycetota bacterium]
MFRKLIVVVLAAHFLLNSPVADASDVLRSKHGAPLKVITRHDSALFAESNRESRSQPLRQFEFFFVLPADDAKAKTKDGFYRVATGTSESNVVGWVSEDDVVEWPHRQVLGFASRSEREPAHFFINPQLTLKYLSGGPADDAISREPEGVEILSLLPILDETTSKIHGEDTKVYRVAYIHTRDPRNVLVSYRPKDTVGISDIQDEITLDIAFVVDTTSSMTPFIDGAKAVIRQIAASVNENQSVRGRVRLALVGYRDRGDEYISKVLCTFEAGTNLAAFESALGRVVPDGGGDNPEQVFAGARTAATELNWNDVANRHMILIGDAPSHVGDKGVASLESVLAAAQPTASSGDVEGQLRQITMHTLRVGEDSGEEWELCGRQFQAMAAGRDLSGKVADTRNVASFTSDLIDLMTRRVDDTEHVIKGEIEEVTARKDPNAGAIGAVLEYLGKEELVGSSFASGYVGEIDNRGNRTVEPYVLVGYNDLRSFNSAVNFCVLTLEGAGDPGNRDVIKIMKELQILTTHANYEGDFDADTPLSEILGLIMGLPVKAKIFEMTPKRLASMTQADYDAWVTQVEASHAMVEGHIENAKWFNLGRETKSELRRAFIKVTDLP